MRHLRATALTAALAGVLGLAAVAESPEGAPDGRDAVVQHGTVVRKKAKATETITPTVDADGAGRVSGHDVQ